MVYSGSMWEKNWQAAVNMAIIIDYSGYTKLQRIYLLVGESKIFVLLGNRK